MMRVVPVSMIAAMVPRLETAAPLTLTTPSRSQ